MKRLISKRLQAFFLSLSLSREPGKLAGFVVAGLLMVVFVEAFTGPGSNPPGTGDPTFWRLNGSNMYYSAGSVGIGTTTPIYGLDVIGTLRATATSTFSGNVGIGTANPGVKLEILGGTDAGANAFRLRNAADNNPSIEMWSQGDATGGGLLRLYNTDGTEVVRIDGRIGSGNHSYFNSGNNVGIGTTNPQHKLDVQGDIVIGTGTTGCVYDADSSILVGTCSSDARLKANVQELPALLDRFVELRPVTFNWREDEAGNIGTATEIGLIAQDVERVFPELVAHVDEYGDKQISFQYLPFYLIQAVKDLKAENENLREALLSRMDALERGSSR